MANRLAELYRSNTTLTVLAAGVLVAAIGVLLIWVSESHMDGNPFQSTVNQTAGLLIATGILSSLWELVGKRAFAKEVYATARIGTDIAEAGVEQVSMRYLEDVQWEELFDGVNNLDIFVAYGRTWRNSHRRRIEAVARRKNGRIRVFLPDPRDRQHVSVLALRFDRQEDELTSDIHQAIKEFAAFQQGGGATFSMYLRKGDAVFSAYRLDNRAVLTLYSHSRQRKDVPTIVVGRGALRDFITSEMEQIEHQSVELDVEIAKKGLVVEKK